MNSDLVLAGVEKNEVSALDGISCGHPEMADRLAETLQAKGWIDLVAGQMLLTLTGRTLLDQRLRAMPPSSPANG